MSSQALLQQTRDSHALSLPSGSRFQDLKKNAWMTQCNLPLSMHLKCLSLSVHRAFTVQQAALLRSHVLKAPSVRAQLSVMGLSALPVAEAGTALVWDSQSPLEAVKSASTAGREPSLRYENAPSIIYSAEVAQH